MTSHLPDVTLQTIKNLKKNGVIKVGACVESEDILIGKVMLKSGKTKLTSFLNTLLNKDSYEDVSVKFPKYFSGIVTKVEITGKKSTSNLLQDFEKNIEKGKKKKELYTISVTVYATEKRKVEIGDKISGRHGNKGIISKILPYADMPYLPDGTPVDMILNPLGIPSRMNVGQIFEGLLNLAAVNLNERHNIQPFDEMQDKMSSQIFVYKKLNDARKKTKKSWLFDPNDPGKTIVFDGRSGLAFDQNVSIGFPYILKLIHLVKDKIHARLTGPYSLGVNQPLRGRSNNGGQRFGEMEVWAMEGFGAAYSLHELLTIKSDDVNNRSKLLHSLMKGTKLPEPNVPEAFKVFILELQALCFDITIFTKSYKSFQ